MVNVAINNLKVVFGDFTALHNIDIALEEGKITTLLGPSGCGKTTTLRSIAGFNSPIEGAILFDEEDMTKIPPQERDTGFVFQNYALWPHMSVFDNIGYGLKIKKEEKEVIKKKVKEAASMVDILDQLEKKPADLSGGQQQRVALARALVIRPKVLLCDEPLSNLDAKLRLEMRIQVRRIVNELGLTCIWVTHDQEEALSLSDHIVVMETGKIIQYGDPISVYTDPSTLFVCEFMSESSRIYAKVKDVGKKIVTTSFGQDITLPLKESITEGEELILVLRPDHLTHQPVDGMVTFGGKYVAAAYMGKVTRLQLKVAEDTVLHFDMIGDPTGTGSGENGTAGISSDKILVFRDKMRVR